MKIYILIYLFFTSLDHLLSSPIEKIYSDVHNNAVAKLQFSKKTKMQKLDDYFSKMYEIFKKQVGMMDQDSNETDSNENKEYITEAQTKNEVTLDKLINDQIENNVDNGKTDKKAEFTIKSIGEIPDRKYVFSITSNDRNSNKENESVLSITGQNEISPKIENSEKELPPNQNVKELELLKSSIEVEDSKDSQKLNSDNVTTSKTSRTEFTTPKNNSDATNETYISNKETLKKYQINSYQKTEASTSRIGLVTQDEISRMISEKFNTENPTKSHEYSNKKVLSTTSSADSSKKDGKLSTKKSEENIHPVRNEKKVAEISFMYNSSFTAMQNDPLAVSSKTDKPTPKEKLLNISTSPKGAISTVHTNSKESSTSPATADKIR